MSEACIFMFFLYPISKTKTRKFSVTIVINISILLVKIALYMTNWYESPCFSESSQSKKISLYILKYLLNK